MTKKVAILGASGYTGAELVRLIATHEGLEIAALSADRKAGMAMADVFPFLRHLTLPILQKIDEIDFSGIDLCFCALPHATTQQVVSALPRTLKIVDLSADFRLRDPAEYERWYGQPHTALDLQAEAVYGLTEFYRDEIRAGRLIAGTGCNAATGQYALRPLIAAGVIDLDSILIDLKAGVSGAGRSLKENLLHAELSGGTHAYSAGGKHRHLGEFDQIDARLAAGQDQADAEALAAAAAATHQVQVARLEDAQGQAAAGEQHRAQREQRQLGHVSPPARPGSGAVRLRSRRWT